MQKLKSFFIGVRNVIRHVFRKIDRPEKVIGTLFIAGAVLVFIPYLILTVVFKYPGILRETPAAILTQFQAGGTTLIFIWWAFALLGIPLLIAYIMLGQKLEQKSSLVRVATYLGVISGIVQMIGLLRWVFVVPFLANSFVATKSKMVKDIIVLIFQTVHQYGGVLVGECLGQLLTIAWAIMMSYVFSKLRIMPKWVVWFGYVTGIIYFFAQAELFATVIPKFPVVPFAGLVGSTLWLIWLVIIGVKFWSIRLDQQESVS